MKNQAGPPRRQAGQTLLEILLAFSVSVVVLGGIVVGISTSLNNARFSKNQNLANSYAQEGMSVVRRVRDLSWPDFTSKTNTYYCIAQGSLELEEVLGSPPNRCSDDINDKFLIEGIFYREVELVHNPSPAPLDECGNGSKVTVTVSWSDSKCGVGAALCHKAELTSCFSNIDQIQFL